MMAGIYPDILKISHVILIYKKGTHNKCCNYRPISLLSPFNKFFEKCLYEHFQKFLTKYSIICPQQYGFRQGHSTLTAVANICNN